MVAILEMIDDNIIDANNDFCRKLMCLDINERIVVRLHENGKVYKKIILKRAE